MLVARSLGEEEVGSQCLMGTEFQFSKRKSSEGWLHNEVNGLNTSVCLKHIFLNHFYHS